MQQHEIKEKREATGISQQELGERIGLTKESARALISAYETNNSRNKPSGTRLDLIRKALAVAARIKKDSDNQWRMFRENNKID
jgi:transcriptional regulator with XRE-family HTH domain